MPDAAHIVPLKSVGSEVTSEWNRVTSQAYGVTPELQEVANLRLEPRGRYITDEDVRRASPVAVIGAHVAEKFFRLRDPIGATFRIDSQLFRVIGVLQPIGLAGGKGSALVGRDWNDDVHIPITTAEIQFGDQISRRAAGSFQNEELQLAEIYITAPDTDSVIEDAARIRRILEPGHENLADVEIIVPWELLEEAKRVARIGNVVTILIASVSLLVGGIGIMNIMLATVTERTREIGIRRALGATRRHVIAQFLVETSSLSMLGGLLGIGIGIGLAMAIDHGLPALNNLGWLRDIDLEADVTAWSIIVSFLVAASVGIVFGLYPAILASRKDPVVALRHD
jgi:putative ABC transport system permease protein